jgi:hypothetical protein
MKSLPGAVLQAIRGFGQASPSPQAEPNMNAAFRAGSTAPAHPACIFEREIAMLRHQKLSRKAAAHAAHRAGPDMALASTIVFFGVFPAVMAAGLVLVQIVGAVAR